MQRLFAREIGASPVRHCQRIHLSKAHALLQQTDLSVTEIAVSAGFGSLEHFCRVYRRQFGRRPRADRRQSVATPVLRRSVRWPPGTQSIATTSRTAHAGWTSSGISRPSCNSFSAPDSHPTHAPATGTAAVHERRLAWSGPLI
jgi:AraC-like DNA-binding protein